MSVMGSALMNMIRKNKKKDSPNQEEKKSRSSDSSSNEMFEKIYSELKSISKRLGDLEGRVDSGNSSTTRKSNITNTTRNINTMKKSNIMKKQSNRTEKTRAGNIRAEKTRAGNVRTENKRRNVKHVIEAYDRRRLQRLVRKRNEEASTPLRKGKEEESKPTQKPSSK